MSNITNLHDKDDILSIRAVSKPDGSNIRATESSRWLALGAVAGPVVFTLAWIILGFLSPGFRIFGTWVSPYSPIHQPISGLGLGVTSFWMNAAFIIGGLLIMVGSVGIFRSVPGISSAARWICTLLFAFTGLGMVVDGIFNLEAIMAHLAGFLLGSGTPVIGFLVAGSIYRKIPRWRRLGAWLLVASPLTLILLVLYFATFDPAASGAGLGVGGLTQRILLGEIYTWFVLMGWLAFRK